jgi:hypothetical protein
MHQSCERSYQFYERNFHTLVKFITILRKILGIFGRQKHETWLENNKMYRIIDFICVYIQTLKRGEDL